MESGEGTLEDFIKHIKEVDPNMEIEELQKLMLGLLIMMQDQIKFWEDNNLYHCDIKLDNFLLVCRDDENVKVMLIDPSQCSYPSQKVDLVFEELLTSCNSVKMMSDTDKSHFQNCINDMIKWFLEKNPVIDFYTAYHDSDLKSEYINFTQSYLNSKLQSFRDRMFEKLFSKSDELEMIDVLMKYFSKVGDADKMIEAAVKKVTTERSTKDKVKERDIINTLDKKLAHLWYSLGRVFYHVKKQPNFALIHFSNLTKLLEAKAELWKGEDDEFKHMKAKVDLQLGMTKLTIGEKTKTLKTPAAAGAKPETSIPDHFIRAIGSWRDLLSASDEKVKELNKKYGLKELDFTAKDAAPGEESKEETFQQKLDHNKKVEDNLNEKERKELKFVKEKQERYAIYLTNGFFWLAKYGFLMDENPKEQLHHTIGPGTKNDIMKDMLDKIVDAVAETRKDGQSKGNMDYSIQKVCLDILKSNFKSIPNMSDLKEVFSDKQSKAADRFK
jgi:hypothetical protein